jgi:hypothetical protein
VYVRCEFGMRVGARWFMVPATCHQVRHLSGQLPPGEDTWITDRRRDSSAGNQESGDGGMVEMVRGYQLLIC